MRMRIVLGLLLVALVGCSKRPSPAPEPAATRDGQWTQDIEYAVSNLTRLHKDPFRFASQERFEQSYAELLASVPTQSDSDLIVGLSRLITQLGDAHTRLLFESDKILQAVPIEVWRFADGYFLCKTLPHKTELMGARIVSIDQQPIEKVVEALGTVIPHENKYLLESRAPLFLRFPEVLYAVGVCEMPLEMQVVLETRDGQRRTVRLKASKKADTLTPIWEFHERPQMLSERHLSAFYSFERLPDEKTLYIAYNKCRDDEERPMKDFAREVLAIVDDEDIERVVLDLRRNGGGNQMVLWPVLRGLAKREVNAPGRLFGLIGLKTFSSALNNSIEFRRWTDGVLIGEPTGQRPNHFGEIRTFRLPNSKLTLVYSTNYFTQLRDDPETLEPDLLVPMTFEDWWNGVDPALEAALDYSVPEED